MLLVLPGRSTALPPIMTVNGYFRTSRRANPTSGLPSIADLEEPMSGFGPVTTVLPSKADISTTKADVWK